MAATTDPQFRYPLGSITFEPRVTYLPYVQVLPPPAPPATPRGWECPKCGAVMAPTQPVCLHCKPKARAAAINAWIDQERGTSGYGEQEGR